MKVIEGQRFYNTQELAKLLEVSQPAIRTLRQRGQLPSARIGRAIYTGERALKAYLYGLIPTGALEECRQQFNKLQGKSALIDTGRNK